ncbi:hypothetical protein MLD38_039931 [Melastoma candidum]|uniref:Uncharacterized protein n=1 Tax=Melastoma candidum TaxID=119954 RepID=A0ACB9L4W0_9MYRT|nr:hypothetical protein MLD38_039931 [Melastoma candidum]
MSSDRKPRPEEAFADFFGKWMSGLQDYLPLLLSASSGPDPPEDQDHHLRALIARLTAHHKQYYTEKWAASSVSKGGNVFLFFSPPWMTPLERAYSWMTGWKPSMAFKLVDALRAAPTSSPFGRPFGIVSEEQAKGIERLRARMRHEEDKVEGDMERQQVGMADRKMVELARMASREGTEGEADRMVEVAMVELGAGMERVMKGGDCVRLKTLKGLLEVLSPAQGVGFLGSLTVVLLRMREKGLKRSTSCPPLVAAVPVGGELLP